jgi:putative ABC transport system ATP-binding protein
MMIRLESIWKTFTMGDQSLHALRNVDETIASGEHVAIMGPSGSGKSTLLNILGCLDQPSRGKYFFDDRAIDQLGANELAEIRLHKIGFIFQSFHLVPRLTALENIELPMTLAKISRAERRERARETLRVMGLLDRADHRPAELSGGQKQRVAIGRAISLEPQILLADEPTGNLDTESGNQILEILEGLCAKGMTLAVVTHDPRVARRSDRVLLLRDGEIVRRIPGSEIADFDPQSLSAPPVPSP